MRASIADVRGQRHQSAELGREAMNAFSAAGMAAVAATVQYQLGQLLDDSEGAQLREQGRAEISRLGLKNPRGAAQSLATGFGEAGS